MSTYSVRLGKSLNVTLEPTLQLYRLAVQFYVDIIMKEWDEVFSSCKGTNEATNKAEVLSVATENHMEPKYNFTSVFYKFPSYYRRAAISEAFGKVSSYKSNLANWLKEDPKKRGKIPGLPTVGNSCPALYRGNCFVRTGVYTARIKVWVRNTWDWIDVALRKTDVNYILRHCSTFKECVPILRKRGKNWSLDFSFEKKVTLNTTEIQHRRIVAVDLGINSSATCTVMEWDGTVLARKFLSLGRENDCLYHALQKIKRAQKSGAKRKPMLWAKANGINRQIAEKTARFIQDVCVLYECDVVVMEALNTNGKKRGGKKQRLHHWKVKYVQQLVEHKCHADGNRISRVCASNTSKLAFDGSGVVKRGKASEKTNGNYSICEFQSGKVYNCDLNASYNIGARYFIREILGGMPAKARSGVEAKVPALQKRSTCTLSDLKALHLALREPYGDNLGDSCAALDQFTGSCRLVNTQEGGDSETMSRVEHVTYGQMRDSHAPKGQPIYKCMTNGK